MTPTDLLSHRPDLALVWRDGEARIVWSDLMPVRMAGVIGDHRGEVIELLYLRDERLAIQAEAGDR